MKTVSIRELQAKTALGREASQQGHILVTDNGRTIAVDEPAPPSLE